MFPLEMTLIGDDWGTRVHPPFSSFFIYFQTHLLKEHSRPSVASAGCSIRHQERAGIHGGSPLMVVRRERSLNTRGSENGDNDD